MKSAGEPNLRRIDPELEAARNRAVAYLGRWKVEGHFVTAPDGYWLDCGDGDIAQHIADCHNHFLPLTNQLLFRERSEEDLHEPGTATREIPRTARTRRFPIPPSRSRSAGTP